MSSTPNTLHYVHRCALLGCKTRAPNTFATQWSITTSGEVDVSGNINTSSNLNVSGATDVSGNIVAHSDVTVSGEIDASGNISTESNLNVSGAADVSGTVYAASFVQASYILIPAGCVITTAASAVPGGWLACDGSAYDGSGTNYHSLWLAIGTTFGGTGITSFRVPNLGGRVIVGVGNSGGSTFGVNSTGGEETHTLSIEEMPAHHHGLGMGDNGVGVLGSANVVVGSGGDTVTSDTGGSGAHNIMQPYTALYHIIKY